MEIIFLFFILIAFALGIILGAAIMLPKKGNRHENQTN